MKTIDRYYLWRWVKTFFQVILVLILLYVITDFFISRQESVRKYNIPITVILLYYIYNIPKILFHYYFLPAGVTLTTFLVWGRSVQEKEVLALLSGGISYTRIVLTTIIVSGIIGLFSFILEETIGVKSAWRFRELERQYFSYHLGDTKSSVSWTNLKDGWTCHILKFNKEALTGRDVLMHKVTPDRVEEIRARYIWWDKSSKKWRLEDGRHFILYPQQSMEQEVIRVTQIPAPFDDPPEVLFALDLPNELKTIREFTADLRRAKEFGIPTKKYEVDWHLRIARHFSVIIMTILTLAFSIIWGKGNLIVCFGMTMIISITYILSSVLITGLGYLEVIPPILSAWGTNLIFATVSTYLWKIKPT
ncbi:MAG: LptF/LptG family permease [Candidatus Hydrogenedentes bacterium]|nr:LptF/LptG family permease [Candidatus Hydrogenedentota bacterium]